MFASVSVKVAEVSAVAFELESVNVTVLVASAAIGEVRTPW